AQPQPSYSWEVLVWFGAFMLISHVAIFGVVVNGGSVGWVWLANVLSWLGICWVLWWYMARRFRRLPPSERHNMMIALGHSLASVATTVAMVPMSLSVPASEALPSFPALLALAGLGFFVVGSTHWSRFFPIALAMLMLAPVAAAWPTASP